MLKAILFLGAFIVSSYAHAGVLGDVNGDGQIGLPEATYALQVMAGIRSPSATLTNIITVAKANGDYSDPVAAVNSISDASANNPYLVVVAPGVYTINQALVMKEHVDIVGSGENVTKIRGLRSTPDIDSSSAIILGANNSTLSSLTVENTGGTAYSIGVYNNDVSPTVSNVTATASGGISFGIYNSTSSPTMRVVTATASGGTSANYGVYNADASSPAMTDVIATATGGTNATGVFNSFSSPTMTNVTAKGSGGNPMNCGVRNTSSSPTMTNVTATGSGGGSMSYGVYNSDSSYPRIRRSTMDGGINALRSDEGSGGVVSQSTFIGGAGGSGNNSCVACNEGAMALDVFCQLAPL
jgi:hypothetical protein